MDPVAAKLVRNFELKTNNSNSNEGAKTLVNGQPSKFDQLLIQRRSIDDAGPGSPVKGLREVAETWKANGTKLGEVAQRVSALPKTSAFDSIRNRLAELDSDYQSLGRTIDRIPAQATPNQLLELQKDMYQFSENIAAISKVVDELATGTKSLLQTQL